MAESKTKTVKILGRIIRDDKGNITQKFAYAIGNTYEVEPEEAAKLIKLKLAEEV